jgi:CRISPR-associated protein Cas2
VQRSVFEVVCSGAGFLALSAGLADVIDPTTDSLRIYRLDRGTLSGVVNIGRQGVLPVESAWIL